MRFKSLVGIAQNMGPRYALYRAWHELKTRSGWLKKTFPVNPPRRDFISLEQWRKLDGYFFFDQKEDLRFDRKPTDKLRENLQRIRNGECHFFHAQWKQIGIEYDWVTNPINGYQFDSTQHWSTIQDLNAANGDIKYVWEKSRFIYLQDVIRFDYHFDDDQAAFALGEIQSWILANPINCGPNYKCSQEIALRIFNWVFTLHYYRQSPCLTEGLFQEIIRAIYWQLRHVHDNIHFSRATVRNNHAITETLLLYLSAFFFPFFPETEHWGKQGKRWFEQEIEYQIFDDGTYLQYSHNYDRVVVQLLTWALTLSRLNDSKLSPVIEDRAQRLHQYLSTCVQPNGCVPNYGSNDGSLFFKLSDADYSDYRGQLNALGYALNGQINFHDRICLEETQWYFNREASLLTSQVARPASNHDGTASFHAGGVYTLWDGGDFTFVRCGAFRNRPAQADNLHIDIWIGGHNVFRDAGTYMYNTPDRLNFYFMSSRAHNTATIGELDQMTKGPRFIWFDWIKEADGRWSEEEEHFVFRGWIKAYRPLGSNIRHHRTIRKLKGEQVWLIEDEFDGQFDQPVVQHWHPHPDWWQRVAINSTNGNNEPLTVHARPGWYSEYYGLKEEITSYFVTSRDKCIKTELKISPTTGHSTPVVTK